MSSALPWRPSTYGAPSKVSLPRTGPKRPSPPRSRFPVRQIRKLRLLATVHPAILDQIGAGDMPKEQELRTIASASREDQAAVWKKFKPKKGEGAIWWQISQALQKTRFFARDAKFGEAEREAFGIVWQEDLFAEGDEDNRFTIDGEAFVSAQRAWVDANMPKNGVWIEIDEYGREKLPPRANRTWTKPKKGDQIGFAIHPRDGTIQEVVFRVSEPDVKKGKDRSDRRRRRRAGAEEDASGDHPERELRSSARCAPRRWSRASRSTRATT